MKIENATQWSTRHLRAIVTRIARKELRLCSKWQVKKLRVQFVYSRTEWLTGWAYAGGTLCRIMLPKAEGEPTITNRAGLCAIIAHELHHISGKPGGRSNERAMRRSIPYGNPRTPEGLEARRKLYAWAYELPLERTPVKEKRRPGDADKLAATQRKLQEWEAKAKRARTAIAKYRRRERYYQKKMTAAAAAQVERT